MIYSLVVINSQLSIIILFDQHLFSLQHPCVALLYRSNSIQLPHHEHKSQS